MAAKWSVAQSNICIYTTNDCLLNRCGTRCCITASQHTTSSK
nr:MAG TPA: hypothetical protein [Bacteriophage sp.]